MPQSNQQINDKQDHVNTRNDVIAFAPLILS